MIKRRKAADNIKYLIILASYLLILLGILFESISAKANETAGSPMGTESATHLLSRLGFGPTPEELTRVSNLEIRSFINEQLEPELIANPAELEEKLSKLEFYGLDAVSLFRKYALSSEKPTEGDLEAAKLVQLKKNSRIVIAQARQAKIWRALLSRAGLREIMTDFWMRYFHIEPQEGLPLLFFPDFENLLSKHCLDRFEHLFLKTAKHPSMLLSQNAWQNTLQSPESSFAETILKKFTLGEGFIQEDIESLARILSGWSIGASSNSGGGFAFIANRHDFSEKIFMNRAISIAQDADPSLGVREGETALRMLATHPDTAKRICFALATYFVASPPPNDLVRRLRDKFLQTNGDIRMVLYVLFNSPEFWDLKNQNNLPKSNFRFVISALRAKGSKPDGLKEVNRILSDLGSSPHNLTDKGSFLQIWPKGEMLIRRIYFLKSLNKTETIIMEKPLLASDECEKKPKSNPIDILDPKFMCY